MRIGGWALALPAMILIGVFLLLPGLLALVGSLFRIDLGDQTVWRWAGLENYSGLFSDPAVMQAIGNTVLYAAMTIIPSLVLGLGLALLVSNFRRARPVLQVLLFLPFATNMVAMAVVFRWIFANHGGFVNETLALVGFAPINFLGDSQYALITVALIGIWRLTSFVMIFYLAGLTSIPTALYEAAAADGLGPWVTFRRVTLPLLRPTTVFATVMAVLQSVQVFDTIDVLTGGGPLGATETILTMTWRLGFVYFDLGQAAALSTLLLVVLVLIGVLRRRAFLEDKEH
ncbi:sugar ABC transporter permease [Cryobacterium melibiosiphilum]|uniref:Sugar ABC transporter permease n=1 Tax=Cryobacterium melibiosiphilum TaxID=995039 RepID=A0A3A5MNZ8_9MICO|nr:sugar ABC transporter permease [Cryobacterium melibiosiphilum]RJT87234.1 sugar ABC transporter permease [Cryobacterium melibiosiphilum]